MTFYNSFKEIIISFIPKAKRHHGKKKSTKKVPPETSPAPLADGSGCTDKFYSRLR